MTWQAHYDRVYWYAFYDLPTGWTAMVSDDSQAIAPLQPTSYTICASSRLLHFSWPGKFTDLKAAKRESLNRALILPRAAETSKEALEQWRKYGVMR